MKTKAKLTLAISVMTAAVLAAGVTSTFAWLTTQSTADLKTGTMTVSTVSDIKILVTKLGYDTTVPASGAFAEPGQHAQDANVKLGTVSSTDGLNFFAPSALKSDSSAYHDSDMKLVETKDDWEELDAYSKRVNTNDYVGYVKYGIKVTAAADTGAARTLQYDIDVNLPSGSKVGSAYRVAFYEATSAWAKGTKYLTNNIFSATGVTSSAHDNTKTTATDAFNTTTYATAAISTATGTLYEANPEHGTDPSKPETRAITTASNIEKYYMMSVWIEGQDASAVNTGSDSISGSQISVDLTFELKA